MKIINYLTENAQKGFMTLTFIALIIGSAFRMENLVCVGLAGLVLVWFVDPELWTKNE